MQQAPPVMNQNINPETIVAPNENTISSIPPAMFHVVNGSCGISIHRPNQINMANVVSPVSTPIIADVILQQPPILY